MEKTRNFEKTGRIPLALINIGSIPRAAAIAYQEKRPSKVFPSNIAYYSLGAKHGDVSSKRGDTNGRVKEIECRGNGRLSYYSAYLMMLLGDPRCQGLGL